jgi:acyl carrier protein
MTEQEIQEKLFKRLREYKGKEIDLKLDTTFDELGFDSLDKVEMLMELEEEYGVTFDDDLQVATLGELIKKISELKA